MKIFFKGLFIFLALAGMCSCIGVNADIVFNADNSGTISLEYRISGVLESLGRLDGNEGRPPLPVGRADIEQSVERLPGIRLMSYASREIGKDRAVSLKLQFADIRALLSFLDAYGEKAVYTGAGNDHVLTLVLNPGGKKQDPDLKDLVSRITQGYSVNISASFNSAGTLRLLDKDGMIVSMNADMQGQGKKVSCSLPTGTVLSAEQGLSLEFRW